MPKHVDHEQRRREIAEAVRRVAADRGLEAVSLGEVAAEAGVSKGLVQHYFPSKDAMLRYATRTLRDRVQRRVGHDGGVEGLRATLLALLPVDDASRTEALVANAFLVRALKDDEIATQFRAGHAELRDGLAAMLDEGKSAGALAENVDSVPEADLLVAMVGGLGDAVLLGHRTAHEVAALIDRYLDRLRA